MTRFCLALLITAVACAGPAAGQTIPSGGTEVFRFALYKKKLHPLEDFRAARAAPHDSVIIVVGDVRGLDLIIPGLELRSFVARGGALLIATDGPSQSPFPGVSWAAAFEIEMSGQKIQTAPGRGYGGSATRPYVRPLPALPKNLRGGPSPQDLFDDVPPEGADAVATDRPGEMRIRQNPNRFFPNSLAGYPRDATRIGDGRPVDAAFSYFAHALRHIDTPGRALFLADDSVFVNGMLGFRKDDARPEKFSFDNGNWQFANRTIDWLQGGYDLKRSKCLFIEDGQTVSQFAAVLPPGAQPPAVPNVPPEVLINWALNAGDAILNEKQERQVFDKFFDRRPALVERIVRYLLIGLTVVFALILLRRLTRAYRKPEATPLPTAVAEGMLPRRGVVWQRTDAQLEVGNLYEAAARRVRDRFDRLGGAPGAAGQMPPVLVANDVRDAELLRSAVAWLWPIGYGDTPVPVSPTEWDRVNALLERLTRRAALGDWSFGVEV